MQHILVPQSRHINLRRDPGAIECSSLVSMTAETGRETRDIVSTSGISVQVCGACTTVGLWQGSENILWPLPYLFIKVGQGVEERAHILPQMGEYVLWRCSKTQNPLVLLLDSEQQFGVSMSAGSKQPDDIVVAYRHQDTIGEIICFLFTDTVIKLFCHIGSCLFRCTEASLL